MFPNTLLYIIILVFWPKLQSNQFCYTFYNYRPPALSECHLNKISSVSDNRTPQNPWDSLARMIENKKSEVENLIKEHSQPGDPLQARMSYMQHTLNSKLSESLRLNPETASISLIADMKRKSPTNRDPRFRNVLDYRDTEGMAENMFQAGFKFFLCPILKWWSLKNRKGL